METTSVIPVSVIQELGTKYKQKTHLKEQHPSPPPSTTQKMLDKLFPEQQKQEKTIKQTRAILGNLLQEFKQEELEEVITLLQYLTESWLDVYERDLFDGMTLNELLNLG